MAINQDPATSAQGYLDDPRNENVLVYVNGEFVPRHDASVSVFDAGFDGVPPRHRRGLRRDADIGAPHAAVHDDLAQHVIGGVAGDRERESMRRRDHRSIDADNAATTVEQRTPGVARIQRDVGLNHIVNRTTAETEHRARQRADDAGRYREVKAERIAHCNRNLPGNDAA